MIENDEFNSLIEEEIFEDEEILWSGRPNPNKFFAKFDLFYIPFCLFLWAGITVAFLNALYTGASSSFVFSIFPFSILGLYMAVGRFFYKRYKKIRTYYALTDKRILEIGTGRKTRIKSLDYSEILSLESSINSRNNGTITFGNTNFLSNSGLDCFYILQSSLPALFDVDNAHVPAKIIEEKMKSFYQEKS